MNEVKIFTRSHACESGHIRDTWTLPHLALSSGESAYLTESVKVPFPIPVEAAHAFTPAMACAASSGDPILTSAPAELCPSGPDRTLSSFTLPYVWKIAMISCSAFTSQSGMRKSFEPPQISFACLGTEMP